MSTDATGGGHETSLVIFGTLCKRTFHVPLLPDTKRMSLPPIARLMVATALFATVSAGCSREADGDGSAVRGIVVRDSAGIEIVEIPESAIADLPRWTIGSIPQLQIGVVNGEEVYQFSEAAFTHEQSDGSIVVMNWATRSIRFFDADGLFVRESGRAGEGPGEYRGPYGVVMLPMDSVLVWDTELRRITVLAPDGSTARMSTMDVMARGFFVGAFNDGSVAYRWNRIATSSDEESRAILVRIGVEGSVLDTLRVTTMPGKQIARFDRMDYWAAPLFSPRSVEAVSGDAVVSSPAGSMDVYRLSTQGELLQIIRVGLKRTPIDADWLEQWKDSAAFTAPAPTASEVEMRKVYDRQGAADSFPSLRAIRLGTDSRIWLRRYAATSGLDPEWLVLESDGTPLAWVTYPVGFTVYEFGTNHLLGVGKDSMDIQYVQRYELMEAGG